jgi:hypothetical protein
MWQSLAGLTRQYVLSGLAVQSMFRIAGRTQFRGSVLVPELISYEWQHRLRLHVFFEPILDEGAADPS